MHITNQQHKHTDVTGVLLAGGKSLRMGQDKALLEFNGQPLFQHSLDLLKQFFNTVMIAGDRPDLATADIPAIPDTYPGSALGGLYTGLQKAQTDWIFVAPCDMPYPNARMVALLLQHRHGVDAVVPRTKDGYEPVFALYHKSCLVQMEHMLQKNQYRIYDFYQRIQIYALDPQQHLCDWKRTLVNLNTPAQLDNLKESKAKGAVKD